MESNISRDHIAMEAMKTILSHTVSHNSKIITKIKVLFGICTDNFLLPKYETVAKEAYKYADSMIAEREKEK